MIKVMLGFRITIEPVYKAIRYTLPDDSITIEPSAPKLEGMIFDRDGGLKAINDYFDEVPNDLNLSSSEI